MANWQDHLSFFGSPEAYAKTIKQKESRGEQLSDPSAAAAFKAARPDLSADYTIKPRETSPEVSSLMSAISSRLNKAPMTAQDIMSSPEYQAQKQVLDLRKGESQAALRRDLASRGMLRSTPAVQALANEDARYEATMAAVVPQLLQAATQREQAGVQNLLNALNAALGVEQAAFSQGLGEFQALAPYRFETAAGLREADQFERQIGRQAELDALQRRLGLADLIGYDPDTGLPTWEREYQLKALENRLAGGSGGLSSYQQYQIGLQQKEEQAQKAATLAERKREIIKTLRQDPNARDEILQDIDDMELAGIYDSKTAQELRDLADQLAPKESNKLPMFTDLSTVSDIWSSGAGF